MADSDKLIPLVATVVLTIILLAISWADSIRRVKQVEEDRDFWKAEAEEGTRLVKRAIQTAKEAQDVAGQYQAALSHCQERVEGPVRPVPGGPVLQGMSLRGHRERVIRAGPAH